MHSVFVCATCGTETGSTPGQALAKALSRDLPADKVIVRLTSCMNLCGEPVAMALCAPGKDSLLFANVDPETQVNEALRLVDLYLSAEGGVIIDARPIGSLRFSMRGRVPAH